MTVDTLDNWYGALNADSAVKEKEKFSREELLAAAARCLQWEARHASLYGWYENHPVGLALVGASRRYPAHLAEYGSPDVAIAALRGDLSKVAIQTIYFDLIAFFRKKGYDYREMLDVNPSSVAQLLTQDLN